MLTRALLFIALTLVAAAAPASRLVNVSIRSTAGSGSETLIVGFVVDGTGAKNVLLRGVGPSLVPFGVPNAVVDPQLALFSSSTEIDRNNDWGGGSTLADAFATLGAFQLDSTSRDAALLKTLQPGAYTAHLVAAAGVPAVALVECYDADGPSSETSLVNVSARSMAGTGSNVLTIGFVITGTEPKTMLLRGIGPTLTRYGVAGALARAQLSLFNSHGAEIGHSFGWDGDLPQVFAAVGAFPLPWESANAVLFFALPPGLYTAQVHGSGDTTGIALVEAYAVENSPIPFVTMQPVTASALEPPFDAGAGTASAGPDLSAKAKTKTPPRYPYDLVRAWITGEALVDFYVKTDGTVANAVVVAATDVRFGDASIAAINQWTFDPERKDGKLVTSHLQQPITFRIAEN